MIRLMTLDDLDSVEKLEAELFSQPWTKDAFSYELLENEFAHYYVIENDDEIIAYCGFWTLYEQAQITTIGVSKKHQGKGYASMLMELIEKVSIEQGCETCSLEVRMSNITAQRLYEKFGYLTVTIRKAYYSDNHEDAFLMIKAIGGTNESFDIID